MRRLRVRGKTIGNRKEGRGRDTEVVGGKDGRYYLPPDAERSYLFGLSSTSFRATNYALPTRGVKVLVSGKKKKRNRRPSRLVIRQLGEAACRVTVSIYLTSNDGASLVIADRGAESIGRNRNLYRARIHAYRRITLPAASSFVPTRSRSGLQKRARRERIALYATPPRSADYYRVIFSFGQIYVSRVAREGNSLSREEVFYAS